MKIFAIRDESAVNPIDLAYLLYYESEKRFYIELPENADPWETPLLLSSFIKKGETSVNSYWSKLWVQQRIVPPDRQNLGQVLKDNHLNEYDEFDLLMLSMGGAPRMITTLCRLKKSRFLRKFKSDLPDGSRMLFLWKTTSF